MEGTYSNLQLILKVPNGISFAIKERNISKRIKNENKIKKEQDDKM